MFPCRGLKFGHVGAVSDRPVWLGFRSVVLAMFRFAFLVFATRIHVVFCGGDLDLLFRWGSKFVLLARLQNSHKQLVAGKARHEAIERLVAGWVCQNRSPHQSHLRFPAVIGWQRVAIFSAFYVIGRFEDDCH